MAEQGITDGWQDAGFSGPGCVRFAGNDPRLVHGPQFDISLALDAELRPGGWRDAGFTGPDCRAFAAA